MSHDKKRLDAAVHLFAGTPGVGGYGGDGKAATAALLNGPAGLGVDRNNNIYAAEIHNHVIRRIDAHTGIITTAAGCGLKGYEGDGGPAVQARLNGPEGVCIDADGNLYIADTYNQRIRRVDGKTGNITTIAGNGEKGYNNDDIKATDSMLNNPSGVVVDSKGNVYFNDYGNDRIRKINPSGIITTCAGTGSCGYSGDGGPAVHAQVNDVYGLGIDNYDNLYIMDSLNFAVRKVDAASGIISTVIGKGRPGMVKEFDRISNSCLGGPVHEKGTIGMEAPHAVEADSKGFLFIADTGSYRIRAVDFEQDTVYTVAGNGEDGCDGDNGNALDARLNVHGLRMDSDGNLYFVDFNHHVIRRIKFNPLH